jgi:nucleoside-diphosphate-sugar epimerase
MKKRVLITGASGWISKAAVNVLTSKMGYSSDEIILISRRSEKLQIGNQTFQTATWNEVNFFTNIDLEYFLPFAFITREQIDHYSIPKFIEVNNFLIEEHLKLIQRYRPLNIINISSGAADDLSLSYPTDEKNVYGSLKYLEEMKIRDACSEINSNLITARLWNCSGFGITKVHTFALGNFILSALQGQDITIVSKNLVYRRYVDITELLFLCLQAVRRQEYQFIHSGGEIIELRDLAKKVVLSLGSMVKVNAPLVMKNSVTDHYFSKSDTYEKLLKEVIGTIPLSLESQIQVTANYIQMFHREAN